MYDAFISYSHAKDKPLAQSLQSVIQILGKAWYKRQVARIFRDDTGLTAAPSLWDSIEKALNNSRYFILMISEESLRSKWVAKEAEHWLNNNPLDTVLIARTGGNLEWNQQKGDFNWDKNTPLGAVMANRFTEEPKWIDLREFGERGVSALKRDTLFRSRAADFAAVVRNLPKEELLSEELTQQKRVLGLTFATIIAMSVLVVFAGWQLYQAKLEHDIALLRKVQFTNQIARRQLDKGDSTTAIQIGIESFSEKPNFEKTSYHPLMITAYKTLYGAVQNQKPTKILTDLTLPEGRKPIRANFSPDGNLVAAIYPFNESDFSLVLWDISQNLNLYTVDVRSLKNMRFDNEGKRLAILVRGVLIVYDIENKQQYVVNSDLLNYEFDSSFAFIGGSNRVVVHRPATSFIDQTKNSPGQMLIIDYVNGDINADKNAKPAHASGRGFYSGIDATGRFFLTQENNTANGPATETCYHIYRISDWSLIPIEGALSENKTALCSSASSITERRVIFNDYGSDLLAFVNNRLEVMRYSKNKFSDGGLFIVKGELFVSGNLMTRHVNGPSETGMFLETYKPDSLTSDELVHINISEGPEANHSELFSLIDAKILKSFIPVTGRMEDATLRVLYANGQLHQIGYKDELGRFNRAENSVNLKKRIANLSAPANATCSIDSNGKLMISDQNQSQNIAPDIQLIEENQHKKFSYASTVACDTNIDVIFSCDGTTLTRFSRSESFSANKLGECWRVRASPRNEFVSIDTHSNACIFAFKDLPVFDDRHCANRASSFFISEEFGALASIEYGMTNSLKLYDYSVAMQSIMPLQDLAFTAFDIELLDNVIIDAPNSFIAMSQSGEYEPEQFRFFPYEDRAKLIEQAQDLVGFQPDLALTQRRKLGIELGN